MGLMTRFQAERRKTPGKGKMKKGGFAVVGQMPTSSIAKQQAVSRLAKEMENDLATLKKIQSIKEKEKVKADTLVPKYMPAVESLKAAGSEHPLLGQILVWLFDVQDIAAAILW